MNPIKLLVPKFRIILGQYILTEGFSLECFSSVSATADWCKLELNSHLKHLLDIKNMDAAEIQLGYDGDYDTLLSGHVVLSHSESWQELIIKNEMLLLERTILKNTFVDCTPQDIMKYIMTAAQIKNYKLSEICYPSKDVFSTDRKNCIDIIKSINGQWGINHRYFFQDRVFYWGCKKEQKDMYILEEGANILSLKKFNGLWEIETLGIPWIHPSQVIKIMHSLFFGVIEVFKTIVRSENTGFVRMYLYFKGGA